MTMSGRTGEMESSLSSVPPRAEPSFSSRDIEVHLHFLRQANRAVSSAEIDATSSGRSAFLFPRDVFRLYLFFFLFWFEVRMKSLVWFTITTVVWLTAPMSASAQSIGAPIPGAPKSIFYVDPVNGSSSGDGSSARPWRTLQEVWDARLINGTDRTSGVVHAGDLIYLLGGNHGNVDIAPWNGSGKVANTDYITITAFPGAVPIIKTLRFTLASKWVVRGITFENPGVFSTRPTLLYAEHSSNLIADGNILQSASDVATWSPADWPNRSADYAIHFNNVRYGTISRNRIKGVHNGIATRGRYLMLSGNQIDYFANDGIQFTSSDTVIRHNLITNHYGLWNDGLHHDAMQGWTSFDETFTTNVLIESNMIINSTGTYLTVPRVPSGDNDEYLQGIVIFDGVWDRLTVINNVVIAAAHHGIGFYGISDSVIANNTVVSQSPKYDSWIGVFQDSRVPQNVVVRNNVADSFSLLQQGVTFDHNLAFDRGFLPWQQNLIPIVDPVTVFQVYQPSRGYFDLRLKAQSPAIGAGSSLSVPKYDVLAVTRNPSRVDIGAYSYTGP